MRYQIGALLMTAILLGWVHGQTPNEPSTPEGASNDAPKTSLSSPSTLPLLFLFRDDKAFRVGDAVTVLVTQTAVASTGSQAQTSKQVKVQTEAGVGAFGFIPRAGIQHQGSFSSQSQERKNLSIITTIACRVVEVSPAGLLRIEGSQEFTVDKRKQSVKFSGWIRPTDISPNNTVLSTQVLDAQLEFKGDWKTRRGKNLLERILEGFNRFLRALF